MFVEYFTSLNKDVAQMLYVSIHRRRYIYYSLKYTLCKRQFLLLLLFHDRAVLRTMDVIN